MMNLSLNAGFYSSASPQRKTRSILRSSFSGTAPAPEATPPSTPGRSRSLGMFTLPEGGEEDEDEDGNGGAGSTCIFRAARQELDEDDDDDDVGSLACTSSQSMTASLSSTNLSRTKSLGGGTLSSPPRRSSPERSQRPSPILVSTSSSDADSLNGVLAASPSLLSPAPTDLGEEPSRRSDRSGGAAVAAAFEILNRGVDDDDEERRKEEEEDEHVSVGLLGGRTDSTRTLLLSNTSNQENNNALTSLLGDSSPLNLPPEYYCSEVSASAEVTSLDYWLCDHCKVAAFDTEEAAEMHESICKLYRGAAVVATGGGSSNGAMSSASSTPHSVDGGSSDHGSFAGAYADEFDDYDEDDGGDDDDDGSEVGSLANYSVQSDGALLLEMTKGYGRKRHSKKKSTSRASMSSSSLVSSFDDDGKKGAAADSGLDDSMSVASSSYSNPVVGILRNAKSTDEASVATAPIVSSAATKTPNRAALPSAGLGKKDKLSPSRRSLASSFAKRLPFGDKTPKKSNKRNNNNKKAASVSSTDPVKTKKTKKSTTSTNRAARKDSNDESNPRAASHRPFRRALSMIAHVVEALGSDNRGSNNARRRNSRATSTSSAATDASSGLNKSASRSTFQRKSSCRTSVQEQWWEKMRQEEERQLLKKAFKKKKKQHQQKMRSSSKSGMSSSRRSLRNDRKTKRTVNQVGAESTATPAMHQASPSAHTEATAETSSSLEDNNKTRSEASQQEKGVAASTTKTPDARSIHRLALQSSPDSSALATRSEEEAPAEAAALSPSTTADDEESQVTEMVDDATVSSCVTFESRDSLSVVSAPVLAGNPRRRRKKRSGDGLGRRQTAQDLRETLAERQERRLARQLQQRIQDERHSQSGGMVKVASYASMPHPESQDDDAESYASSSMASNASSMMRGYAGGQRHDGGYDAYVRSAIDRFRQRLGVSDEAFEDWKQSCGSLSAAKEAPTTTTTLPR